jgi:hypothetical protein
MKIYSITILKILILYHECYVNLVKIKIVQLLEKQELFFLQGSNL